MEDTPEYDFLPKFVPCPVCKKLIVEDSVTCKYCNTQAGAHFARIKEIDAEREEQKKREREQDERDRVRARWIMGVIGVGLLLWIASCISNANPPPKQYYFDTGTHSATPGAYLFQASGKIKLTYSCSLNSGKVATAELSLVDLKTSKAVWTKQVKCAAGDYEHALPEYTDTTQLKSSNYDVGIKMSGNATWNLKITQV